MTLSKERVEFYATTEPPFGYTGGDIQAMARELLERRERDGQEPVAYMVGGYTLLHAHDPKVDDYLNRATPLYAAPPCSRGESVNTPPPPFLMDGNLFRLTQQKICCVRVNRWLGSV